MGVDLSPLAVDAKREITLKELENLSIAIDGHNALYQFLTIIRQPDGTPLMDRKGEITSHLSGLLYRTSNLVETGIKPLYVFDGKPPDLKKREIATRVAKRAEASEEYARALEEGDLEKAFSKAMQSAKVTHEVVKDSKKLLEALGIPFVEAPSEGEAQAAHMVKRGDVWATASQDFDSLLFGSRRLARNITITGRRKLPRKSVYITVKPELIELDSLLKGLEIDEKKLVDLAILIGTDFNEGVKGVGPRKALSLIKKHGDLERALEALGVELEVEVGEVKEIFLNPSVRDDYVLEWRRPDPEAVKRFLCDQKDFSEERVEKALSKYSGMGIDQRRIDQWF
jgi:flap endonuclease-1